MTAPTKPDLLALDFASDGQPFISVVSTETMDTSSLDFARDGQPFVAAGGAAAPDPGPSSARPACFVCT